MPSNSDFVQHQNITEVSTVQDIWAWQCSPQEEARIEALCHSLPKCSPLLACWVLVHLSSLSNSLPPPRTSQGQAPLAAQTKNIFRYRYWSAILGSPSFRQRRNTLELFYHIRVKKNVPPPNPLGTRRRSLVPILCQSRWQV